MYKQSRFRYNHSMANIATDPATGLVLLDYAKYVAQVEKLTDRLEALKSLYQKRLNIVGARVSKKRRQLNATVMACRTVEHMIYALYQHAMILYSDLGEIYATRWTARERLLMHMDNLKTRALTIFDRKITDEQRVFQVENMVKRMKSTNARIYDIDRAMMTDHV